MKHLKTFNENNYPTNEVNLTNEEVLEIEQILNIAKDEEIKVEFDVANNVESRKSEFNSNMIELYNTPNSGQNLGLYKSNAEFVTEEEFLRIIDNIVRRVSNIGDFKVITRLYFNYKVIKKWATLNRSYSVLVDEDIYDYKNIMTSSDSARYKEVMEMPDTIKITGCLMLFVKK